MLFLFFLLGGLALGKTEAASAAIPIRPNLVQFKSPLLVLIKYCAMTVLKLASEMPFQNVNEVLSAKRMLFV